MEFWCTQKGNDVFVSGLRYKSMHRSKPAHTYSVHKSAYSLQHCTDNPHPCIGHLDALLSKGQHSSRDSLHQWDEANQNSNSDQSSWSHDEHQAYGYQNDGQWQGPDQMPFLRNLDRKYFKKLDNDEAKSSNAKP